MAEMKEFKDLYNERFMLHSIVPHKEVCKDGDFFHLTRDFLGKSCAFICLENCNATIVSEGKPQFTLKRDEIAYLPGGADYGIHILKSSGGTVKLLKYIMINCENVRILCSRDAQKLPQQVCKIFAQRFEKIYNLLYAPHCLYAEYAGSVYNLFADMISIIKHNMQDSIQFLNISRGITYIEEHFTSQITNRQLAQLCSVSQDFFVRTFKKYYHNTPKKYILELRISKAKELLALQVYTVNEIALELGFGSATYFSRVFRNKTGMSPTQYGEYAIEHTHMEGTIL